MVVAVVAAGVVMLKKTEQLGRVVVGEGSLLRLERLPLVSQRELECPYGLHWRFVSDY